MGQAKCFSWNLSNSSQCAPQEGERDVLTTLPWLLTQEGLPLKEQGEGSAAWESLSPPSGLLATPPAGQVKDKW